MWITAKRLAVTVLSACKNQGMRETSVLPFGAGDGVGTWRMLPLHRTANVDLVKLRDMARPESCDSGTGAILKFEPGLRYTTFSSRLLCARSSVG